MKSIKLIGYALALFVAAGVATGAAYAGNDKKSKAVFETTVHDFGMVKEDGGPVSCEFPFQNKGGGNLVIFEASAQCGCTKPEYPKAPVAPGKTGVIKVTYNPLGRPGGFDKVVTIKCNGNPSKIRLKIRGTVSPKGK